jgi:DNA-directed RNA polymerase specialized sigma24 family protein
MPSADRALTEAHLDTEGVVQEAFEPLLRFPMIATVNKPEAWLCTVARQRKGTDVTALTAH